MQKITRAKGKHQSQTGEKKAEYRRAIMIRIISSIVFTFFPFVVYIITHDLGMSMTNGKQQKEKSSDHSEDFTRGTASVKR